MLKRIAVDPYEQFLRQNRAVARAADTILEGVGEFSHLKTRDEFVEAIAGLNSIGTPLKPESTLRDLIEKRLFSRRLEPTQLRLFSLVCRAAEVAMGYSPWHHQVVTALLLNRGLIVQLPNGSGKTLAIAMAASFAALSGNNAHLVTSNDYLAERDARWMGKLYQLLGLSVGIVFTKQSIRFGHGILESDGVTLRVAAQEQEGDEQPTAASPPETSHVDPLPLPPEVPRAVDISLAVPFEYEELMASQRQAIDRLRGSLDEWRRDGSLKEQILRLASALTVRLVARRCPGEERSDTWDWKTLGTDIYIHFGVNLDSIALGAVTRQELTNHVLELVGRTYEEKEELVGASLLEEAEGSIFQHVIDDQWSNHVALMAELTHGIAVQAGGPVGSMIEYQTRAEELFRALMERIGDETLRYVFFLRFETSEKPIVPPEAEAISEAMHDEPGVQQPAGETAKPDATGSPDTSRPRPPAGDAEQLIHDTRLAYYVDRYLRLNQVLACDVVYSRIETFAFAFLRDNLAMSEAERTLARRDLLIIDECDAVLLDDLSVPILITQPTRIRSLAPHILQALHQIAKRLRPERDFLVDGKSVQLTFQGLEFLRQVSGRDFFSPGAGGLAQGIVNALKAEYALRRDEDYVRLDNQIVLVELESGRLLHNRTYDGGLHEALMVKEGFAVGEMKVKEPIASITARDFVRTYVTVAGTSGAIGSRTEYEQFYGFDTVAIEPYPKTRREHPDLVYRTKRETVKFGVIPAAVAASGRGQPVLINVPRLSDIPEVADHLKRANLPFQVLDAVTARTLGDEAEKIQRAGSSGLVTVSSKLAARGTDIVLDPAAIRAGGLFVIGLQRETDRRFDDQLRGRAGRHGDPGDSLFVLSMEDELLRMFGGRSMQAVYLRIGMEEGVPIESDLITRRISAGQRAIQRQNHVSRIRMVELDDIRDRHRTIFYRVRQKVLAKTDLAPEVATMLENWTASCRRAILRSGISSEWSSNSTRQILGVVGESLEAAELNRIAQVRNRRTQARMVHDAIERKISAATADGSQVRDIILGSLDEHWRRYLATARTVRDEFGLYPQDDPAAPAKYAETMEQQFDSFFYEVGEDVLSTILRRHTEVSRVRRASA